MLDILYRWNRWGSNSLDSGIVREITAQILSYSHTKELIVLIGSRRSGKSTILYQIMDALEKENISQQAMLHLNFEEPKVLQRELEAIEEAKKQFPKAEVFIVSKVLPEVRLSIPYKIIPLWLFLLEKTSL